jgi:hypothetical protein
VLVSVGTVVVNVTEVCKTVELGTVAVWPDPAVVTTAELITELVAVEIPSAAHGVRSSVSPPRVDE